MDSAQTLTYDPAGAFWPEGGVKPGDLDAVLPRLLAARDEMIRDLELWNSGDASRAPEEKRPLDAGFHELPERMLAAKDELARLTSAADALAAAVDRVVLLGIGGSYMGARALMEALCDPYHNQLSRAARRQRPRLYFEGDNVDNDSVAALGELLSQPATGSNKPDPFGIVVISKSGQTLETAVALRVFLAKLLEETGGEKSEIARRLVPITGPGSRLDKLCRELGCGAGFEVPDGVGGRFSILSAVGLLPAAVLGLDVRRLLEGAVEMNRRFRQEPAETNPVLRYVGVGHLWEQRGCTIRVLSTWGKGLEAVGFWYDQLLSESLGKMERGATPLTVVNTRDLHSRGQQHQEGRRDKLITNLVVKQPRRAAVCVPRLTVDQDDLNRRAGTSLATILSAAIDGTNQAYRDDHRPTATISLPQLDEFALGQLFQVLMLATVLEGRLLGINPYGQTGVEAYKRNMGRILG